MGATEGLQQLSKEELKKFELAEKEGYLDVETIEPRIISHREYGSELVTEYNQWNSDLFNSIATDDPDIATKLKPIIRQGVPNSYKRAAILKLFNVVQSEAKVKYENALKVVYGVSSL
eukprot:TRINITY_DN15569_c0_g1_i2.p2 TRINITY_DN15569_c0_g1~~TRINITY_DN15569_c0_g1_i2.p2  ORF type:complete len:118 (-),score=30.48 TRINITY_DN15569_c0_g1_i2:519-872(-)